MVSLQEFLKDTKGLTKFLIGAIITLAGAMQLDVVKNFMTPIVANHPKISSIIAGIVGLGLLLQNPQVQKALHINELNLVQQGGTVIINKSPTPEEKPHDSPPV
jgi:hypothetical protein